MYGNVNRKKKKDGTLYKDYFYYACKHRRLVDGHKCGYRKQWSEEKINNAVEEVIRKLVKNPKFEDAILNKIGSRIDTEEIEKEIEGLEKQHRQLTGAKARLGQQMDSLDIMDKFYEKKYQDMETRLAIPVYQTNIILIGFQDLTLHRVRTNNLSLEIIITNRIIWIHQRMPLRLTQLLL